MFQASCRKLYGWLKVAPYQVEQQLDDEDDEFDSSRGLRVMGVCYSTNRCVSMSVCVCVRAFVRACVRVCKCIHVMCGCVHTCV